jgi:hypothetical protein
MAWWEYVILAYIAAMILFSLRSMVHHLGCKSCRLARQAIRDRHPTFRVGGSEHRAWEADRDVVAVFYKEPRVVCFPPAYRLVAVVHDGSLIEELPDDRDSRYAIRGRK